MPDWLTTIAAGTSVLDLIFITLAISAIIGFIIKIWPKLRALVKLVDTLSVLPEFMERTDTHLQLQDQFMDRTDQRLKDQEEKVIVIHHEMQYNSGTSMKDATRRNETKLGNVEKSIETLNEKFDVFAESIEEKVSVLTKTDKKLQTQIDENTQPR